MFIRNKQENFKTSNFIHVNAYEHARLLECGYSPLSHSEEYWVYRKTQDLEKIIDKLRNGGNHE